MNSIEQCIIERASHEQELKMTLKKLSERQLQIQQCKVQEVQSSVTSSGDETSSGIVSDEEIEKKELEAHYGFMAKIQEVSPEESSSTGQPLEQVPIKKAQSDKPCLYEIPYDTSDPANRFAPDREETMTLDNESRSKLNKDYVKPYDYTKQNSLYEIFKAPSLEYLYQLERGKESQNDSFRFEHELKTEMHEDFEYVKSLENEVDELESEKADFSNMYDLLLEEWCDKGMLQYGITKMKSSAKTFDHSRSSLGLHGNDFKAGSKSCSSSSQDNNITTRVGITIPPSNSNAEDNSIMCSDKESDPNDPPETEDQPKDNPKLEISVLNMIGDECYMGNKADYYD
ncbi:hypothetical protein Tco_1553413 [Tanacetum coccineum]